tara:strand:- start:1494 stop:2090 length:597 start_codon:yes stop_codon:yes gene_type:complete
MTDGSTTLKLNDVLKYIKNASHDDMVKILLEVLSWFKLRNLGNPFNYNRAFEFIVANNLGYVLLPVGGGSDAVNPNDPNDTIELKGTEYKGLTKKGLEKSHSFSYNGTSRKPTLKEQEEHCKKKIMRDKYHYWTMTDYENGELVKTLKIKNSDVWTLIWTKWEKSWYNVKDDDPRIGGSISTNLLKKMNIPYEVITHS